MSGATFNSMYIFTSSSIYFFNFIFCSNWWTTRLLFFSKFPVRGFSRNLSSSFEHRPPSIITRSIVTFFLALYFLFSIILSRTWQVFSDCCFNSWDMALLLFSSWPCSSLSDRILLGIFVATLSSISSYTVSSRFRFSQSEPTISTLVSLVGLPLLEVLVAVLFLFGLFSKLSAFILN